MVENNWLSVSEKTELEIAKKTLRNSTDPIEREKAQQKYDALREKDIVSDQKVIDACNNGNAASSGCAQARLDVITAKGEYENTGNYNSRASQQYADAYSKITSLLSMTSVDAQNQKQVQDAMVNYAMVQLSVDKPTAEAYIKTYDGMKIISASMTPLIGSVAARKIETLVSQQRLSSNFSIHSLPDAHGREHITAVKGDAAIPVDKIEIWLRGKAKGDLESLLVRQSVLINEKRDNQRAFAKDPNKPKELGKISTHIEGIGRSRTMGMDLEKIGFNDTKENNKFIIDKLLDTAKMVTPENRWTSIVLKSQNGSNESVRINAVWVILPDGSKRLSTVTTGRFLNEKKS